MSQFHSVLTNTQLPAPGTGNPGDVFFITSTGLLWFIEGLGNPIQLLTAVPIPVSGPTGPPGPQGLPGLNQAEHFPTFTQIGGVVATTEYGVRDTGRVLVGISEGTGHEFKF